MTEPRYMGGFPITLEAMVAHARAHGREGRLLRLLLTDENGEPRDGVVAIDGVEVWDDGAMYVFPALPVETFEGRSIYVIPAEMLEADDG